MASVHRILAIFIGISLFIAIHGIQQRPENSLYGPFEAGAPNIAYWDLTGHAQLAQNFLRLTTDETGTQGGIWNNYPVLSHDWELHIQFHIHGKGMAHSGDGLAIWYVRDTLQSGHVFGNKDYFHGLGIFIDTTEDSLNPHKHKHPYISAVVSNGSQPYEHNEDGTVHQIGGCHMPMRNLEWPTKIAVSYIGRSLTIFLDVEGQNQWSQCFKSEGVHLPTHYFFGVTASTGEVYSDNHDIVYITALDMVGPDQQWIDQSYIIPFAENVLIHPKEDEIAKTIQQLHEIEEQLLRVEEKFEAKEDIRQKQQLHKNIHHETPPQPEQVTKTYIPEAHHVSLMTKIIYILGIFAIFSITVVVLRRCYAQRQERIQKRLY